MNMHIQTLHPDLTALVLSKYLIRKSISPNPRILADGTIRYMIVSPSNNQHVWRVFHDLLQQRGLPYTVVRVEFNAEDGCYVDFKVKS